MTDSDPGPKTVPGPGKSHAARIRQAREARRAAALKANLRRRKEQSRARSQGGADGKKSG